MQSTGRDFVKWNNPYNKIIGTSGNPNFAAAVMAVIGVVLFSLVFIKDFIIYYRVLAAMITVSLFSLIYQSDARQGLLSFILGTGLFLVIFLFGKYRKLGLAAAGGGVLIFIFAALGMLQIGPLESFLYKQSVSVRGYYWRAGFEMLKHHPLFGVGLDRYGANFKQYREVEYPLTYGFDITSSNAHNTFIQLFATGGIFLGLSYLLLNAYILKRAIFGLRNLTGNNRLLLAGIFSAWVAFQAQSLVSIDNIGISVWGWVLGGSIIGLSISSNNNFSEDRKQFIGRQNNINLERVFISSGATFVTVVLVTLLYRGEVNSYNARVIFNSQDQTALSEFKKLQIKVINTPLMDPSYSLISATNLIQNGFIDEGLAEMKKIYDKDPKKLDSINGLAMIYEKLNNIPEAISYRLMLAKLDQWNAINYLQLGIDYKAQGDLVNSKAMLDKILAFAPYHPIALKAKAELAP
jgi:tetratricopeptide (TPR) repeat protein